DRLEQALGARLGRRIVPVAGLTAGGALLTLGVCTREPVWIVTWLALAMGAVGMSEGPFWATAIELGGLRGGSAAGVLNFGGNAGGLLAPVVTPWVGQRYGWAYAVGLGALVCLVAVVLWFGVEPGKPPRDADEV